MTLDTVMTETLNAFAMSFNVTVDMLDLRTSEKCVMPDPMCREEPGGNLIAKLTPNT